MPDGVTTRTQERHDADPAESGAPTGRPWLRSALLLVAGVAVGIGVALAVAGRGDAPPTEVGVPDVPQASSDVAAIAVADGDGADAPVVDVSDATTPTDAVRSFLAAEVELDFPTSHAYLAEADLERYPSPERWRAAHSQLLPLTGFVVVDEVTDIDGRTAVRTALALDSGLDPVVGLVPARAEGTWFTEQADDGTWRVDFTGSRLVPIYPEAEAAVAVVEQWAAAAVACRDPGALQAVAPPYGTPALVDQLCDADGDVVVGAVTTLPETGGSSDLLAAFGTDVVGWARVVPITSPVELDVVLAPVDDAWGVIGVLPRGGLS